MRGREAELYKRDGELLRCTACSHRCRIRNGSTGVCRIRKHVDSKLYLLVYGEAVGLHADPIEKKPLYHFLPGSKAFSFGTVGCDFRCAFCQNWDISQARAGERGRRYTPEEIVARARTEGCASIAYTYNEPAIFMEYARDTARCAHDAGLRNVFVSNGYETAEAFGYIEPYLDAINIDLKAFTDRFYRTLCGARLEPVLDTIRRVAASDVWLEVTTLVIPDQNDSDEELRKIATFIATLDASIPWHISRFFPQFKMSSTPPTPIATLQRAERIGRQAGLHHIYIGNAEAENATRCSCGEILIERAGYHVGHVDPTCRACGKEVAGVWN